jgi:hypothetical protein
MGDHCAPIGYSLWIPKRGRAAREAHFDYACVSRGVLATILGFARAKMAILDRML